MIMVPKAAHTRTDTENMKIRLFPNKKQNKSNLTEIELLQKSNREAIAIAFQTNNTPMFQPRTMAVFMGPRSPPIHPGVPDTRSQAIPAENGGMYLHGTPPNAG